MFLKIINLLRRIIGYPIHLLLVFTKNYIINPFSKLFLEIRVKLPKIDLKNKKIPINFNK